MKTGKHDAHHGGAEQVNTLEGIIEQRAVEKAAAVEVACAETAKGKEAQGDAGDQAESEVEGPEELLEDVPEAMSEPEPEAEVVAEREGDGAPADDAGDVEVEAASVEVPSASEAVKPRKGGKIAGIVCGAVCGVVVLAYLAGALYFSSHFFSSTTVNGEDVSGKSVADLAALAAPQADDYSLKVQGDNLYLKVRGDEIGLAFDADVYAQGAAAQIEKWTWPFELGGSHVYTVQKAAVYDGAALQNLVDAAVKSANKGAIPPKDAEVGFDKDADAFRAKQPEYGTTVDASAVYEKVCGAVSVLEKTLQLDESVLLKPKVTEDDEGLAAAAEKANKLLVGPIELEVNDTCVYKISRKSVAGWISFTEKLKPSIDEEAIRAWVLGSLSKKLDSVGSTRKYKMKGGRTVTVSGGTYGWSIDAEKLAKTVASNVKDGDESAIAVPMKSKAQKWNPGGRDWGRYIDIDLADQVATLYDKKNKVLWRSEIVSGNTTAGHGSPTGVYVINDKATNQTLIGSDENGDGEPDYKTPVSYWMPFVDNSIALHDASWRGAFGGSIYMTNGSHGCINLPTSAAASLYNMIRVGDVVSCHY